MSDLLSKDKAYMTWPRSNKVIIRPSNEDEEDLAKAPEHDERAPFRAFGPGARGKVASANLDWN